MKVFIVSLILTALVCLSSKTEGKEIFENLSATFSNTLVTGVNRDHEKVYDDFSATAMYAWTTELRSAVSLGLVKSFTQDAKTFIKDIVLETAHANLYTHTPMDISLRGYVRGFLPTSIESRNRSQALALKSGLGLSKTIRSFLFGYELSGSYFFHRYKTAKNGSSNKHYGMTNTLTASYQFSQNLMLNTVWSLLNFATYNETPKATYSFIQEIDYAISQRLNLAMGLSTGGRQFKNNEEEFNISLFDVEGTEIFFTLNYLL